MTIKNYRPFKYAIAYQSQFKNENYTTVCAKFSLISTEQFNLNLKKVNEEYESIVSDIVAKAEKFETAKEKVKFLYDWIISNVKYDYSIFNKEKNGWFALWYLYKGICIFVGDKRSAIVAGISRCLGMSAAYKDLCDRIGIECRTVDINTCTGKVSSVYKNHVWNEIVVDGVEYFIDVSSARVFRDTGKNPYKFFMKPLPETTKANNLGNKNCADRKFV